MTTPKQAATYNTNLTHHLYMRMVYHPENKQYALDYQNRGSKFKKAEK